MSKRSKSAQLRKPKKPYPDFPLSPHASGKWQKKIRGKLHYFGQWARRLEGVLISVERDGWEDALREYKEFVEGRASGANKGGLLLKDLCNHFLTAKQNMVDAGEMTSGMFYDYKRVTDLLVEALGKDALAADLAPADFARLRTRMAAQWGPVRLKSSIIRVRSVFKFGYDNELVDRPARFGTQFKMPVQSVLRRHKAQQAVRLFTPDQIKATLDGTFLPSETGPERVKGAGPIGRACILLGINCGFGQADCAELPTSAVNLETGWIDFPRPKTGITRRCPLWPETIAAIRAVEAIRPKPATSRDVGRVLLSGAGTMLVQRSAKGFTVDLIAARFTGLIRKMGFHKKQIGFYTLRHTFETIAGDAKDQVAVDAIMGHVDHSMAGHYRERIEDTRLRAVVDHVRKWLWPNATN